MLCVPGLHSQDRVLVLQQHGMHPVTEQTLGELGILAASAHEVAERAEHSTIEALTYREQCRGSRGQPNPITLQLLQSQAARRKLCQGFFSLPSFGSVHRFMLARFGNRMTSMLGNRRSALRFVAQESGAFDCRVTAAFHRRQLLPDLGTARICLRCPFT
jgi:hypothetical protein